MVELEIEGETARLRLNRPEARNALPIAGWEALAARTAEAEGADVRLLLLEGCGGSFSAGADLGEFPSMCGDEAAAARFRQAMRRGLDSLAALPVPTIAVIEGPCYGAAVALALACDIRLAGSGARFAITPARMGISYPQEDVSRLVALVGAGWASRLLFTGDAVGADEAVAIGLCDGRSAELGQISESILAADPASCRTLKRAVRLAESGVTSDREQDRLFDQLLASEALAARLEARRKR